MSRDTARTPPPGGDQGGYPPPGATQEKDPLRTSKTSGTWLAVVAFVLLLVLLIVFIAQNTRSVHVNFLGWDGDAPLAVVALIAAAAGLGLAVIAASLRLLQVRRRVKRERKGRR